MPGFSAFVLTNGNILFRSMPKPVRNCLFSNSASLSLVDGNSLAHKLRVTAAAKLHLNATYAQHLALKWFMKKGNTWVMGGQLFSSEIIVEL